MATGKTNTNKRDTDDGLETSIMMHKLRGQQYTTLIPGEKILTNSSMAKKQNEIRNFIAL
jgi:hypothetical protein